jgi:tetratricopeptide (TPR) repeat protein
LQKQKFPLRNNAALLLLALLAGTLSTSAQTVEEYFQDGLAKYKADHSAEAVISFNKALELRPDYSPAFYGRALAKMELKDSTAEADLAKAIALNPEIPEYYFSRGKWYFRKDDYPKALLDFDKAIELRSNFADAYCYRGETKEIQKDFHAALADENKAVSLKPEYTKAWYVKGICEYVLLDFKAAILSLSKCLGFHEPVYLGGSHYFRGMAELKSGQKDAACQDFNEALKADYKEAETAREKYCN